MNTLSSVNLGDFDNSELGESIRAVAIRALDVLRQSLSFVDDSAIRNRIAGIRLLKHDVQQLVERNIAEHELVLCSQRHILRAMWDALHERDRELTPIVQWGSAPDQQQHANPVQMSEHFQCFLNEAGDA